MINYFPLFSATRSFDVTATSKSIALPSIGEDLYISNPGSKIGYIRFSPVSGVAATGADFPVIAGDKICLRKSLSDLYMSAVCDTGETTTIKVSSGRFIK